MIHQPSLFEQPPASAPCASFHNTINPKGSELIHNETQAKNQEETVLNYFRKIKRSTALRAAEVLGMHEVSCRRAVTNLFNDDKLRKTDERVLEKYKKFNYVYEVI